MGKSATPRVGDFATLGLSIRAECACGHVRLISAALLARWYGPEARLYPFVLAELAKRLRCTACEAKEPVLSVGHFAQPPAPMR